MASTAQLNVRMDASLKAAGDAALAQIGYAPVDFVRAVWGRLARQDDGLAAVRTLLGEANSTASDQETLSTPMEGMRRVSQTVSIEMRRMGRAFEPEVSLNTQRQADEQDREMLWECMQERLDEHAGEHFA